MANATLMMPSGFQVRTAPLRIYYLFAGIYPSGCLAYALRRPIANPGGRLMLRDFDPVGLPPKVPLGAGKLSPPPVRTWVCFYAR